MDDILDIFRSTFAEEVIFVLPNKSRAFSSQSSFAVLHDESQAVNKNVLILSENLEINALAAKYNFGILANEKNKINPKKEAPPPEKLEKSESFEENPARTQEEANLDEPILNKEIETEDEAETDIAYNEEIICDYFSPETVLTASPRPLKSMSDIVNPDTDDSVNVKINKKTEQPVRVEINKALSSRQASHNFTKKTAIDEIQTVWQRKGTFKKPFFSASRSSFSLSSAFSKLSKKALWLYGFAVVIIFGFVLYASIGKAEITIKPRAHSLDFTLKITASDAFLAVDPALKKIPGQLFSVEKKIEDNFDATGEKDVVQKARGKIIVYNEYGTPPQVLIATTRFESENGSIFRTLKTITVPGTTVRNGQISPGAVEVEVIADKAGDTYNISPGKFTIPAFKEKGDLDRYGKFYGKSTEAMKGGIIGKAKVVTEQDYINAKKEIEEKIAAQAEQELKTRASGLTILKLPQPDIKEIIPSAQIDEAVNTFVVSGTAQIQTVGFKDSDLHNLLIGYIQNLNEVVVLPDKLALRFEEVKFNEVQKILEFTVLVNGHAYSKINEEKIITDLMGKGEDGIKQYIKNVEDIASAKVVLSPFWVWKVPSDRNKIHIKMEYD